MTQGLQMESAPRLSFHEQQAIQAASEAVLSSNSHLLNEPVFCSFRDGIIILTGRVRSFYKKQIAQTIVAEIAGVQQVVNQIEVDGSH